MDLVEVYVVHPQATERGLALLDDVPPVVAARVGVALVHHPVHLGGEDDRVPLPVALERLPHDLLARADAVDVGRVEKVYPRVDGAVDDPERVLLAGPPPEHHAAQAQLADLDPRAPKVAVLHAIPP